MFNMNQRIQYVLWGAHPNLFGGPVRLKIGTLRECRGEQRYRESIGGYTLAIHQQGTTPEGLCQP